MRLAQENSSRFAAGSSQLANTARQLSDESLAERARGGDLPAMDILVRRWQPPLLAFLRRRVGSSADAEDLFQETFLRVHQSLAGYDPRRPFRTWLFTSAWRLAANHCRNQRLRFAAGEDAALVDPAPSPLDAAAKAEARHHLWQTASRVLGPETTSLLWLFYAEGLSSREIAQVSGRSWVSVKVTLHRARQRLAESLSSDQRMV